MRPPPSSRPPGSAQTGRLFSCPSPGNPEGRAPLPPPALGVPAEPSAPCAQRTPTGPGPQEKGARARGPWACGGAREARREQVDPVPDLEALRPSLLHASWLGSPSEGVSSRASDASKLISVASLLLGRAPDSEMSKHFCPQIIIWAITDHFWGCSRGIQSNSHTFVSLNTK
jgi:hypothetical protein